MKRKSRTTLPSHDTPLPYGPTAESDPCLFIQAHEADIIRGSRATEAVKALEVDEKLGSYGSALVRWNQFGEGEREIWVDRYDARLLLDSLPPSPPPSAIPGWESPGGWSDPESASDDIDEETSASPTEPLDDIAKEAKRRRLSELQEERVAAIRAREVDEGLGEDEGGEQDWASDEEPDDAQKSLIHTTFTHILSSPNPTQLEMRILANHGNDPRFTFLRGRWKTWVETERRKVAEGIRQVKGKQKGPGVGLGGLSGYGSDSE